MTEQDRAGGDPQNGDEDAHARAVEGRSPIQP